MVDIYKNVKKEDVIRGFKPVKDDGISIEKEREKMRESFVEDKIRGK